MNIQSINQQKHSHTGNVVTGSQKLPVYGALASLGCAATFLFGFVLLATQLLPYISMHQNPDQAVKFILKNHTLLSFWNFVIYILFGALLTVLIVALHHRLLGSESVLSQLSTAFGLVWVNLVIASGMLANVGLTRVVALAPEHTDLAQSLWLSVITTKEGLGGGNEIIGGVWIVLVSLRIKQSHTYSKVLSAMGLVAGVAGIISTVSLLRDFGAVFGLLLIVWFIYLGILMMREATSTSDKPVEQGAS